MIRKATTSDFDFIYSLYMHPQVNPFLLYEMMDATEFKPIFEELLSRSVLYIYEDEDTTVGMFKLVPLTYRNTHIAYLGGLAIDPSSAGKGYGIKMLQQIIDYAKEQGFLRIELSVATINEKAIRLYEKVGFVKEGIYRKYTYLKSENRFLDEVIMSWLCEN
ncbi:MAG TPA: GNAT family protein [Panacibacter sp.]|nr:GNAT family protein [Panacibacter sp.]